MSILKFSRDARDLSKKAGFGGVAKGLYKTFLGGKKRRMATGTVALTGGMAAHGFSQGTKADTGAPLKPGASRGYEYSHGG